MAYYVNGTLIGGANTLPKMTMAEYLALPVSERPTYWECTDKDYDEISAENVSYGSGTVKDALDKLDDSGWIELNSTYPTRYRKKNGIVFISIKVNGNTPADQYLGTLPEGFRPTIDFRFPNYSSAISRWGIVLADGRVSLGGTATGWTNITCVFPV